MSTVYQVAGVTIAKDLIFGWVVQMQGEWYCIEDLNVPILKALLPTLFPAWIPEELRELVRESIEEKEALNARLNRKDGVYIQSEPKIVPNREKDAEELKAHLLAAFGKPLISLEEGDSASLDYVTVYVAALTNEGREPLFLLRNKKGGLAGTLAEPVPFKTIIDLILRIWW